MMLLHICYSRLTCERDDYQTTKIAEACSSFFATRMRLCVCSPPAVVCCRLLLRML